MNLAMINNSESDLLPGFYVICMVRQTGTRTKHVEAIDGPGVYQETDAESEVSKGKIDGFKRSSVSPL